MKKLAVIVPCYNEEAVIEESYRRTKEVFARCSHCVTGDLSATRR